MTGKELANESTVTVYAVRYYANIGLLRPMRGERPIVNLLGGIKVSMNKNLTLGFAVQAPVTSCKDFTSQLVFQPDIEWRRKQ